MKKVLISILIVAMLLSNVSCMTLDQNHTVVNEFDKGHMDESESREDESLPEESSSDEQTNESSTNIDQEESEKDDTAIEDSEDSGEEEDSVDEEELKRQQEEEERKEAERIEQENQRIQEERKKQDSIALANLLSVTKGEILNSPDSRLLLDDINTDILENIVPECIDETTQEHLTKLKKACSDLEIIKEEKEHLSYIYSQETAHTLIKAFVNNGPILSQAMDNIVSSPNIGTLLVDLVIVGIKIGADNKYEKYQADIEYLQRNWSLDKEQKETLDQYWSDTFNYVVDIVRNNGLEGNQTLSAESVDSYIEAKNTSGVDSRLQFYESQEATYQNYGDYWLERARAHFENGEYRKCLDDVQKYEELDIRIFWKDKSFARIIPMAIASEQWLFEHPEEDDQQGTTGTITYKQHANEILRYLDLLEQNTSINDWELRFFAAQTYVSLYQRGKKEYLRKAYDLAVDSLPNLVRVQRDENMKYLNSTYQEEVPSDLSQAEKKIIQDYNASLSETRKTELPPIYDPLLLYCEFIFTIKDRLDLTEDEINRLDGILYDDADDLFLYPDLDNKYRVSKTEYSDSTEGITFDGETITIPAIWITENAQITMTVDRGDTDISIDDWSVSKVNRKEEGNVETFYATLSSKELKDVEFEDHAIITFHIVTDSNIDTKQRDIKFKVSKKYIPVIWKEIKTKYILLEE